MQLKPISKDWTRTINCITSAFTVLALAVGGGWSLYQYFENRSYQLQTERFESIKPMFEERLKLYVELTAVAGTIAANKNDADVVRAKARFMEMYYGPIGLVEDSSVWSAAGEFAKCIEDGPKCTKPFTGLSGKLAAVCVGSLKSGRLAPAPVIDLKVTTE
jgi:hypothetical protein